MPRSGRDRRNVLKREGDAAGALVSVPMITERVDEALLSHLRYQHHHPALLPASDSGNVWPTRVHAEFNGPPKAVHSVAVMSLLGTQSQQACRGHQAVADTQSRKFSAISLPTPRHAECCFSSPAHSSVRTGNPGMELTRASQVVPAPVAVVDHG
jgi:hypothetical protein